MLWFTVLCVSLCVVRAQYQTYFPAFAPIYNDGIDIEIQEYDNAITISTSTASTSCGYAISGIGDINDDGIDDYAYSCPYYGSNKGAVVVIFGGSDLLESDFTYPTSLSSSDGFTVYGDTGDALGDAIVGNFDYNMDGVFDFLVCAASAKSYAYDGLCYVIFGHGNTDNDYPFKNIFLNDTSYDSYNKYWFMLYNSFEELSGGRFGSSVASGDVNGDGFNDIIIGSSGESTNYVVVMYSKRGFVDDYESNGVYLSEQLTGVSVKVYRSYTASFGYTLSCSDFNNDGSADILVGTKAELVYVIWGSSTDDQGGGGPSIGSLSFSDINEDTTTDLYSSRSLIDFYDDYFLDSSNVSVIYGANNPLGQPSAQPNYSPSSFSPSSFSPSSSSPSSSSSSSSRRRLLSTSFGMYVTSLDFNGDGYDDIAIGDDGGTTESSAGAVYIIFGSSSPFTSFYVSTGTVSQMAVIYGDSEKLTGFGTILASAGDINDDGYDDILVGGQGVTSYYALAYVIYGVSSDSTPLLTSMLSAKARGVLFYSSTTSYTYLQKYIVASIGDVNNDGISDIAMSVMTESQVFVVFGSSTYFQRVTLAPSYEPTYKPSVSIDECAYYLKNYAGIAPPTSIDESIPVSEFNPLYIKSIAVDSGGNIYFLDMRDSTYIRKYTINTESVSVVVGGGTTSISNEIISQIAGTDLNLGMGFVSVTLRVDSNDDLLFAYYDGVYRLSVSTGTVSKIIGSNYAQYGECADNYDEGPVSALSACAVTYGQNLAVDSSDNVYFFDYTFYVIRKYSAAKEEIQTLAGTGVQASNFTGSFYSGISAELLALPSIGAHCIDILDGIVYFTYSTGLYAYSENESSNQEAKTILLLTSSSAQPIFSSSDYYYIASYSLMSYTAKIRSGSDGNLYIAQSGLITQVSIVEDSYMGSSYMAQNVVGDGMYSSYEGFASSGGTNRSTTGQANNEYTTSGFVRDVEDICFEQGMLYIADNSKFIRQVKNGNFSVVVGQATVGDDVVATNAYINYFSSMAWDSYNNYLYVADTKSFQVHRISSDGILENYVGVSMPNMRDDSYYRSDYVSRTSVLIEPASVAVDSDGLLYFDDKLTGYRKIRKIDYSGYVATVVGSDSATDLYSETATSVYLNMNGADAGIAIYNKNLFFVNLANNDYNHGYYIGKLDMETKFVTIFAGSAECAGVSENFYENCPMAEDDAATKAHIHGIQTLTVDSEGNVYYYDNNAYIIRSVSSAGIVTTIAGTGTTVYSTCSFPYQSSPSNCYGTSSNINALSALAVDVYSNVYFGYAYDKNVFKIDGETGLISTFFSSQSSGWPYNGDTLPVADAYISGVSSLAYDGENLYIGDVYNQLIRKMVCASSYFSFDVEYSLVGVTEAQYNEDKETNDMVFKLSFISALESEGISGLTTADIVITDVQDVNNIMAKYVIVMLPIARTLLSSGIKITSQVVVFPNVLGYSQSSGAFNALSNAITSSYTSGAFASALSTYSSTYNSVLTSATPSTVVSPSISGYTGSDDDDYTGPIDKVYPMPPYKSFAMLLGLDKDTSSFDIYCAIATPIIFTLWMIGIAVVMFNTEHSNYQGLFFVAFSVLSTLNMYFDTGNVTSSWFVDWASLWMSILFSWLLPATCFLILTIIKNELFPWFVTDYFIGRVLSRKYGVNLFWFWLSHTKGLPLINNQKQSFSFENHDSLPKVIMYLISWILLIVCQLICLVPFALWVAILSPYYIIMCVAGIFLVQTKLMVNNTIWNTWCALFTNRANRYAKNVPYDTRFFNETLLCEFLLQSIPQLIIKFINNTAIDKEYTYALSTPALSLISAIILFIRYVVLVVVFDREILDVPFFFKFRYKGNTLKYGIKKSPHDSAANKEAREAYLEYWTRVHNNCKADLLYLGTYQMLRYVFFKIEDSDNASLIKKSREPLLLALRQKDMCDVSSLALATDTMHYLLKDSKDMKLYRYLQSVEVREPLDLLDITEDTLNGILKCINNYKVKEIVNANLHILLLSNLIARDSLLVKDASISSKHLSSKFGSNKYRQLMFPLLKIDGQVDLGVVVDDEGLYVSELGEISFKAGIALNDRVLAVNGSKVRTVEDYYAAVEESNVSVEHHNSHNQVRILVARVNNSFNEQRPGSTSDDLYNVFRKSTVTFHSNNGRKSMYSSLMRSRQEHVDADAIMKMNDRQLLKMFKKIDKDDSGTIEEPELQKFLEELHVGGAKTAKSMMDLVDVNGDGEITKEEFLIMMHKIQGKEEPQSQNVSVDIPVEEEVQAVEGPHRREYNPFKLFRQHTEKVILGKKNRQDDDLTEAAPQYSQVEMTMQGQNEDDALA